jgi:hypothetical protein
MNKVEEIIEAYGGVMKIAKMLKVHRTRVSWWKVPKSRGGTGGIPHKHIPQLMKNNIHGFTLDDFMTRIEDDEEAAG